MDAVVLTESSALVIQVKSVRMELDLDQGKLQRAEDMIVSDPEIMRGTSAYRGTRIPVELIADMLSQGAPPEEILDGYPALDREKVELAPLYVQAFPRRGRPAYRPWAKRKAIRAQDYASLQERVSHFAAIWLGAVLYVTVRSGTSLPYSGPTCICLYQDKSRSGGLP